MMIEFDLDQIEYLREMIEHRLNYIHIPNEYNHKDYNMLKSILLQIDQFSPKE